MSWHDSRHIPTSHVYTLPGPIVPPNDSLCLDCLVFKYLFKCLLLGETDWGTSYLSSYIHQLALPILPSCSILPDLGQTSNQGNKAFWGTGRKASGSWIKQGLRILVGQSKSEILPPVDNLRVVRCAQSFYPHRWLCRFLTKLKLPLPAANPSLLSPSIPEHFLTFFFCGPWNLRMRLLWCSLSLLNGYFLVLDGSVAPSEGLYWIPTSLKHLAK